MRIEKFASELRQTICLIMQREIKDPRIGFITVTGVDISADLKTAKVYFSALGDDKQKKASGEAIKSAAGFIRSRLGDYMRMRYTPALEFRADESVEYDSKIEDIFKKINEERSKDVS